jgi:hypothetical protein
LLGGKKAAPAAQGGTAEVPKSNSTRDAIKGLFGR